MPATLTVKAHAKVNLYLHVVGRRADGFHDLDTLFERVSLHDMLTFRSAKSGIALTCTDPSLEGESNLVWRAAELMRFEGAVDRGVRIHLKKQIPVAGGMGGGSSDGAATLLALNRFWRCGLSQKKLLELALKLGSDVPFFVLNASVAAGQGRGEKLRVVPFKKKLWHVLAFPGLKVLTKEIFASLVPSDFSSQLASATWVMSALAQADGKGARLVNSLERALFDRHPQLAELKRGFLEAGCYAALASGSGPTMFGLATSKKEAASIASKMKKRFKARFCVASTT